MNSKLALLGLTFVTLLVASDQVIFEDAAAATPTSFLMGDGSWKIEQRDKEALFKVFNEKKRSNMQAEEELAEGRAKFEKLPRTFTSPTGIEFVLIPPGKFMMGSIQAPERPVHEVTIREPFYIGKYEVTQAHWLDVMGSKPSFFEKCGSNCPVEMVSWRHAERFISRLNSQAGDYTYRLPTEAEWEYVARAGTTGDFAGNLDAMAWYRQNSDRRTHPVGTKQPNAWGVYDMHGNVWEWCKDRYEAYKAGPAVDPTGPARGGDRVFRGGSWYSSASYARSAYRFAHPQDLLSNNGGFRVVAVVRTP